MDLGLIFLFESESFTDLEFSKREFRRKTSPRRWTIGFRTGVESTIGEIDVFRMNPD